MTAACKQNLFCGPVVASGLCFYDKITITMENYKNIYNSICRLCLSYSNSKNMISLFDKNSPDGLTAYAKAVSAFANVSFTEASFPSFMCLKCVHLLKQAIHFKLVTESSDNCLKKLKDSVGCDGESLKEKIIEFTMLKFYFPNECFKSKENTNQHGEMYHNDNSADDAFFDSTVPGSETEDVLMDGNEDKILDEMESLIGSNTLTSLSPTTIQKMFESNMKGVKRKCPKEQMQDKNFVCNFCNKVLANQTTYDHHMQRHTGCRYICEHCSRGFPVLNQLHMHQVTKHGTGPYLQCSHCPFKAPRRFDLKEHERIHTGERPYTCDKCGLNFRRREIWRKHLIHHAEKTIQCPQCPKKFYLKSDMQAHANNIHDRMYVYACSKCAVTYTKTATVRRHMTERHGIPREMQGKIIRINKGSRKNICK